MDISIKFMRALSNKANLSLKMLNLAPDNFTEVSSLSFYLFFLNQCETLGKSNSLMAPFSLISLFEISFSTGTSSKAMLGKKDNFSFKLFFLFCRLDISLILRLISFDFSKFLGLFFEIVFFLF